MKDIRDNKVFMFFARGFHAWLTTLPIAMVLMVGMVATWIYGARWGAKYAICATAAASVASSETCAETFAQAAWFESRLDEVIGSSAHGRVFPR